VVGVGGVVEEETKVVEEDWVEERAGDFVVWGSIEWSLRKRLIRGI
jgi:hypothetical protein